MADDLEHQGPQVRAEVVRTLTRPARLPPDRANALLNATAAERAVASRVLLAEAADVLTQAGVLRPQHTVLDLGLRHVQALAAALGRLASWWPQPALEHRPLGDVLKVVPAADAALVVDLLVWGGWLHEQPSSGQQQGQEGGVVSVGVNVTGPATRSFWPDADRRQPWTAPGPPQRVACADQTPAPPVTALPGCCASPRRS